MKKLTQLTFCLLRPLAVIILLGTIGILQASPTNFVNVQNLYDGSDIEVSAEAINGKIVFTISNKGSDMDSERGYEIIEDDILVRIGNFDLTAQGGNEIEVDINASPGLFTIYADQHPNYPGEAQAIASIEIFPSNYVSAFPNIESDNQQFELIETRNSNTENTIEANVYPNPCTSHLFIRTTSNGGLKNTQITISNLQGNIVEQITGLDVTQQINTTKLNPGYYIISIQDEKGKLKSSRFIKN